MDKRSMDLLEKAFAAEIEAGTSNGIGLMQTRSKLADKLVEEGYLEKASRTLGSHPQITVTGYQLTHLGRITYCSSC